MPSISDASSIRFGSIGADKVFFGSVQVWPPPMTAYAQTVLADAPMTYWPMSEPSGTTCLDLSGHGRTLSLVGDTTRGDTHDGIVGTRFDGGRGTLADAAWMADIIRPYTIEVWFRTSVSGGYLIAQDGRAAGSRRWGVGLGTDGTITACQFQPSEITASSKPDAWALDTWNHAVTTVAGTKMTVYINGAQVESKTGAADAVPGTAPLTLAANGQGVWNFAGTLARVAIYTKALSPTRLAAHYAAGRP